MIRDTMRTSDLVSHLRAQCVLATGLNYPVVPRGEEEIRFQISADHTKADIDNALAALAPWIAAYIVFPNHRKAMRWASLFTMPFGFTEPLFVPEYWNPPSLFNLAQSTGFDI